MAEDTSKKVRKPRSTTKKTSIKEEEKLESLNAEYKYEPSENEVFITDMPNEPLVKIEKIVNIVKTNKEIYESYISDLNDFKLIYNNDIIYDSSLTKTNDPLSFENDYFILFGKKFSYNGLRIVKIN